MLLPLFATLASTSPTYRLVALDLDGTLLNRRHALSETSIATLRSLADRGVDVALCSGRSAPAMQAAAAELDLCRPMPIIAYNGALGLHACSPLWTRSATELFLLPVPADAVEAVLRVADEHGLLVQYYVGEHIHVACKTEAHMQLTERYVSLTGIAAHQYVDTYDCARALGPPYKMLVMGDDVDSTLALLQADLPDGLVRLIRGTPPFFVEVLSPRVHKGEGLRRLCEAVRIPLERTVAFGDGDNDVEFCDLAGLGYAMANTRQGSPLWEVADRCTEEDNEHDGVAMALRSLDEAGELATCAPRTVRGSSGVLVRRAAAADDVVGLRERVLWPGRPDLCVLDVDDAPGALHLVAAAPDGERTVGVISLFLPDERGNVADGMRKGRAQFRKLAVDEAWRRCGIGSTLVDVAAAEARLAGCATLFCHARELQAGFYEQQGFVRAGSVFRKYEASEERYVEMELEL